MGKLLTIDRKKELLKQIKTDARLNKLWQDFCTRVQAYTKDGVLIPMYEPITWWFYVWDRIGDASFVYAMTGDETAGKYVYNCVMDMCKNKSEREWIGDWFRTVDENPPIGKLETAHISCAIVVAYDFCGDLFSDEEKELIENLLRNRALPMCRRFLEKGRPCNNWKMVLLNGYTAAAFLLQDKDAIEYAVEYFNFLTRAYNKDSYGESLQYSNYSALHLLHAFELMTAYDNSLSEKLDTSFAANMMRWYASSLMYMKPMNDKEWGDEAYPRSINFGDSATVFRPTGDVLMHIIKQFSKSRPIESGLAMWLFETTYKEKLDYFEGASYGLGNDYSYFAFINYVSAKDVKPLSPQEAGLPLVNNFETGTVIYRNSWDNPELILGIQGGYKPTNLTAHRHLDQNSFILAYHNERMLADPGHTCYRLHSMKFSELDESHNTWTFEKENGEILHQTRVSNNVLFDSELQRQTQLPMNILERCEMEDNLFICQSDCAKAYGDNVEKAQRIWVVLDKHIVIVFDRIKTKVPLKLITHFVVNNRGNKTDDRVFYEKRVVMRRNGIGMKLIPLEPYDNSVSLYRSWGFMHDCYCSEPNRRGQGKEGSALIYNYKADEYAQTHVAAYAIVLDSDNDIRLWHVKPEDKNSYYISKSTDAEKGFYLVFKEVEALSITDLSQNKNYEIK